MAGACGNRTHPASLWPATLDLKSRRDTRTLCTPVVLIVLDYLDSLQVSLKMEIRIYWLYLLRPARNDQTLLFMP